MKGIIFNLLESAVTDHYGPETWEHLIDASGGRGAYTSLGNYPDEELYGYVRAASEALGVPAADVVRWVGAQALPRMAEIYPTFFKGHTHTRTFLLTLNDIIHPEVRKLYPQADVPDFDFDLTEPGVMRMTYRSHRKLCALAEGLIMGAAAHYGETAAIEQETCMHRGDDACVLAIRFSKATA